MERGSGRYTFLNDLGALPDIIALPRHLKMNHETISAQNREKTAEKMNNKTILYQIIEFARASLLRYSWG